MKLLIVSDTHRYIGNTISFIEKINPDYIIHLGDVASDCDELISLYPNKRIICVLGNNDFFVKGYPYEIFTEFEDFRFFICHGHKYNVKYGLFALKKKAMDLGADVVLFGHTHSKMCEKDGNITYLNPGSIHSCGLIEIKDKKNISFRLLDA